MGKEEGEEEEEEDIEEEGEGDEQEEEEEEEMEVEVIEVEEKEEKGERRSDSSSKLNKLFHRTIYPPRLHPIPTPLTPTAYLERHTTLTQIRSLGNDFDEVALFGTWTNEELRELLEVLMEKEEEVEKDVQEEGGKAERVDGIGKQRSRRAAGQGEAGEAQQPATLRGGVTVAAHIHGTNDLMSGALLPPRPKSNSVSSTTTSHSSSSSSSSISSSTSTITHNTLPHLYRHMPHYMISVRSLKSLSLFSDPAICDAHLPPDFYTTVKGLKRAWDEASEAVPDPEVEVDDVRLVEAVRRRGGSVKGAFARVVYPEDIVPLDGGEGGDGEFWEEVRGLGGGGELS